MQNISTCPSEGALLTALFHEIYAFLPDCLPSDFQFSVSLNHQKRQLLIDFNDYSSVPRMVLINAFQVCWSNYLKPSILTEEFYIFYPFQRCELLSLSFYVEADSDAYRLILKGGV